MAKKNKTISFDKLEEKYFGKKGTPMRDRWEKDVAEEISNETKKQGGFIQFTGKANYTDFANTFVMKKREMLIPLKPNQKFKILKIEINRAIGKNILCAIQDGIHVTSSIPLYDGERHDIKSNWIESSWGFINTGNLRLRFKGFKKGDEITIHYTLK